MTLRRGLAAGLAYWRHASLFAMWGYWKSNAAFLARHRRLLAVADSNRVKGNRKKVFAAWADRLAKAKRFRASVETLGRALGLRDAAPMFREWRAIARCGHVQSYIPPQFTDRRLRFHSAPSLHPHITTVCTGTRKPPRVYTIRV